MCHVIVGFHVLRVDVSLDLGFSRCHWCRTSHRSAGRFYTSTSFHHACAIPSTKFFLLDVVVRLCPVIVHTICIPKSCIFHIANGSFEVLSLQLVVVVVVVVVVVCCCVLLCVVCCVLCVVVVVVSDACLDVRCV